MTRDEIISMARECGIRVGERWSHATLETSGLLHFAALVVAREREECALIADEWATDEQRKFGNGGPAAAIRARADHDEVTR